MYLKNGNAANKDWNLLTSTGKPEIYLQWLFEKKWVEMNYGFMHFQWNIDFVHTHSYLLLN